jgi:hypothetical protein
LKIASTYSSPSVYVSDIELVCIGNFWMENSFDFFEYIKSEISQIKPKNFTLKFFIHHIHSTAVKQLFEFLKFVKQLEEVKEIEKLQITFCYLEDDIELKDLINDMSELLELNFNVFALPDKNYFFN